MVVLVFIFFGINLFFQARLAFERALELDPDCVGAMVGIALLQLNSQEPEAIRSEEQGYIFNKNLIYRLPPSRHSLQKVDCFIQGLKQNTQTKKLYYPN